MKCHEMPAQTLHSKTSENSRSKLGMRSNIFLIDYNVNSLSQNDRKSKTWLEEA